MQDLERLNKIELLGWDDWSSLLIQRRFGDLRSDDFLLLDRIAELTLEVDHQFDEMQKLYESLPDSEITRAKMREMELGPN